MDGADGEQHRHRRAARRRCPRSAAAARPARTAASASSASRAQRGLEPLAASKVASSAREREPLERRPGRGRSSRARCRAAVSGPSTRSGARPPRIVRSENDEPLAEVVDRRVRHLREALAEVRVERPRAPGERRQRRVVAHRRGRLVRVRGDRPQDRVQVLPRVAERGLARRSGRSSGALDRRRRSSRGRSPSASQRPYGRARGEPRA